MKPHLILPMGGAGSRFLNNGYIVPKPIINIEGKPFFYWSAMSVRKFVEIIDITFVTLRQHVEQHGIDQLIYRYFPEARVIVLPEILPGPVYTCLEGVRDIDDDAPIIFNDCDHMFRSTAMNNMLKEETIDFDGALVTFPSSEPQFSYVDFDAAGRVIGTVEKKVVSDLAICGAYLFRNVTVFRKTAEKYVGNCSYSECFMSGLYNVLCAEGKRVVTYPLNFHLEFGTPEEYEKAMGSPYFLEINQL